MCVLFVRLFGAVLWFVCLFFLVRRLVETGVVLCIDFLSIVMHIDSVILLMLGVSSVFSLLSVCLIVTARP